MEWTTLAGGGNERRTTNFIFFGMYIEHGITLHEPASVFLPLSALFSFARKKSLHGIHMLQAQLLHSTLIPFHATPPEQASLSLRVHCPNRFSIAFLSLFRSFFSFFFFFACSLIFS